VERSKRFSVDAELRFVPRNLFGVLGGSRSLSRTLTFYVITHSRVFLPRRVLLIGPSAFIPARSLRRMRARLQFFFTLCDLIVALYGLIDGTVRHSGHASVYDSRALPVSRLNRNKGSFSASLSLYFRPRLVVIFSFMRESTYLVLSCNEETASRRQSVTPLYHYIQQ